jgi:predicted nucleotide-binding protein (sugar kinase/HSP70/actin superfamily)
MDVCFEVDVSHPHKIRLKREAVVKEVFMPDM